MKKSAYLLVGIVCAGLCACSNPKRTAPIADRSVVTHSAHQPIDRNTIRYTVQRGDTLSQLSRRSGHSVAELAAWNQLADLNDLRVGQVLRMQPPDNASVEAASVTTTSGVEVRSIDAAKKASEKAGTSSGVAPSTATAPAVVSTGANGVREVEGIRWSWPTEGKMVGSFMAGKNRGIDIAGTKGQKILSAADGTVLHKGSMNGYGNLVIIKHSDNVLSAYAHNDRILVKEKQQVKRGEPIAEMGNTDSDRVKLHFEIRYQGKPVDPVNYLPVR